MNHRGTEHTEVAQREERVCPLFGHSDSKLKMRKFPILFLSTFRPAPKTTLSDGAWFFRLNIFVHINAVAPGLIDHQLHLMRIMRNRFSLIDLGGKVRCRNLALAHSHMTHLWPIKIYTISNRVNPFVADHSHRRIDVYVFRSVSDSHV